MLGFLAVCFFCIEYFAREINSFLNLFKDAAGIWHEDRFRPLVTAIINLVLNLITVNFWGIYGVIGSTFVTIICINIPWQLHNLFSTVFEKEKLKQYCINLVGYVLIAICVIVITYLICYFIPLENEWVVLAIRLVICIFVPNLIFFIIYHQKKEFKQTLQLANRITRGKLKFLNRYENIETILINHKE